MRASIETTECEQGMVRERRSPNPERVRIFEKQPRAGSVKAVAVFTAALSACLVALPAGAPGRQIARLAISVVEAGPSGDRPAVRAGATRALQYAQRVLGRPATVAWVPVPVPERGRDIGAPKQRLIPSLERAARASDLVIAWGDILTDATVEAAKRHPAVRFVLVTNISLKHLPSNLSEGIYDRDEQAFLAGVAAALASRSHVVGFIGPVKYGSAVEHGRKMIPYGPADEAAAYAAGAHYITVGVNVLEDYLGLSITITAPDPAILPRSWREAGFAGSLEPSGRESSKTREVALAQYDLGADVVYAPLSTENLGAYEAAAARDKWMIARGQTWFQQDLPGDQRKRVLAVITERPDAVAYSIITQFAARLKFPQYLMWGLRRPFGTVASSYVAAEGPSTNRNAAAVGIWVNPQVADALPRISPALAAVMDLMRRDQIKILVGTSR
jgi:basic membrane lipoprotein Med (substrate-binding protein (PBP1-ABC) superfamily)